MHIKFISRTILAFLLLISNNVFAIDTYNPANGQLTISTVVVGDTIYKNVVVMVNSVISVGGSSLDKQYPTKSTSTFDTYDAFKNQLSIPNVSAFDLIYYDVVINVGTILAVGSSEPVKKPPIPVQSTSYLNAKNLNIPSQKIPSYIETSTYREDAFAGIAFGDFLQDGSISLVTFTNWNWTDRSIPWKAGSVYFYKYVNGEPVDITSKILKDTTGCMAPRKLLVADFNNDGKPDVYASCHGSEQDPDWTKWTGEAPRLLLSQPDGTYKNIAMPFSCYCHGSTAGDIDGDGNIDIITSDFNRPYKGKSSFIILKGDGKGGFTPIYDSIFLYPEADSIPWYYPHFSLELLDVDGDGKLDLYLGNGDWYPGYLLKGDGKGKFMNLITKLTTINPSDARHYHFNDIVFADGHLYLMANKNWDSYRNEVRKYNISDGTYTVIYNSPSQDLGWFNNFIFMMPYNKTLVPYNSIFNVVINR